MYELSFSANTSYTDAREFKELAIKRNYKCSNRIQALLLPRGHRHSLGRNAASSQSRTYFKDKKLYVSTVYSWQISS